MNRMPLPEFVSKWKSATLTESAAAQSHFIDLCNVLGEKPPTDEDVTGDSYTFEKGVAKTEGGEGWALLKAFPTRNAYEA